MNIKKYFTLKLLNKLFNIISNGLELGQGIIISTIYPRSSTMTKRFSQIAQNIGQ